MDTTSDTQETSANPAAPEKEGLAARIFNYLLTEKFDQFFKFLRNTVPILELKKRNVVIVTRFKDVQEVLTRPLIFNVTYGPMTTASVGGPYMLGEDGTKINQRDKGVMRSLMQREDLPKIAQASARLVNEVVEKHWETRQIEMVSSISRWVPAKILDEYFGFPGPDIETLCRWSQAAQRDIFHNLDSDDETKKKIHQTNIEAGLEMQAYARKLIAQRREQLKYQPELDDILSRLLKTQFPNSIGFDDERIVANILGIVVGGIQTPNIAIVNILEQILKRPQVQEEATAAAHANDDQLLYKYCWEALRFNPANPFVVRVASADYVLASGSWRNKVIRKGTTVLASARSGMRDRREVPAPDDFCIDRPAHHYFHVGYGMHTCLGDQVAKAEIVEIIKRLLKLPNLKSASEINYYFGDDPAAVSPFPESYYISFDPNF